MKELFKEYKKQIFLQGPLIILIACFIILKLNGQLFSTTMDISITIIIFFVYFLIKIKDYRISLASKCIFALIVIGWNCVCAYMIFNILNIIF